MSKNQVKFGGSIALALSVVGVLLAVGGQLNFLGNKRQVLENNPQGKAITAANKPKYSFYDELKRRKTEIDDSKLSAADKENPSKVLLEKNYRYVVQVGAFSYQNDANKVKRRVEGLGYPTRIVKTKTKYLTQAGPFRGKAKAIAIQKKLKKKRFPTLLKRLK